MPEQNAIELFYNSFRIAIEFEEMVNSKERILYILTDRCDRRVSWVTQHTFGQPSATP